MKKIIAVFGTRPEAVKMCPLILELKKRECFEVKVCLTGQHRDLLDRVTEGFGINADFNLSVMKMNRLLRI